MQIVLNLSNDLEAMLKGYKDREGFILQAIKNELQRKIPDTDFTPEQLASIERGKADVKEGRTISHNEMKAHFKILKNKLKTAIDQQNGK